MIKSQYIKDNIESLRESLIAKESNEKQNALCRKLRFDLMNEATLIRIAKEIDGHQALYLEKSMSEHVDIIKLPVIGRFTKIVTKSKDNGKK